MSFLKQLLPALVLALGLAPAANALVINVSFTSSTYAVQAGDDYASLLAQHNAGVVLGGGAVATLDGVSTSVHAPGNTTDYSVLMSVDLMPSVSGSFEFQAGVDWGRGGIAAVINNTTGTVISEYVRTDDLWWAYNWNNADVFTTQVNLNAGDSYTLAWIGFEGCCAGSSTIRYSFEGSAFTPISTGSMSGVASVPESGAVWLASSVLLGLGWVGRRKA